MLTAFLAANVNADSKTVNLGKNSLYRYLTSKQTRRYFTRLRTFSENFRKYASAALELQSVEYLRTNSNKPSKEDVSNYCAWWN